MSQNLFIVHIEQGRLGTVGGGEAYVILCADCVIDTGTGIPPEKQALIFEPFIQAENGARQLQGTGLGLPISRSLIRAHGGELWVESEGSEGSAFFFTLPIDRRRQS